MFVWDVKVPLQDSKLKIGGGRTIIDEVGLSTGTMILSKTKCDYHLKVNSYDNVVLVLREGSVLTIHVIDGNKSGH